jgi:hypothetical protein
MPTLLLNTEYALLRKLLTAERTISGLTDACSIQIQETVACDGKLASRRKSKTKNLNTFVSSKRAGS